MTRANDAAEPSIGVNRKTGNVMYQSYTATYRVTFDDATTPAGTSWVNKPAPNALTSLDPILPTAPSTSATTMAMAMHEWQCHVTVA